MYFTRLVLGVQLVIAGIQLPHQYLKKEWRSLSLLLGPGMCAMWITTALLVWAMVPNIPFLYALAIGSCVTPTDPVLSASIVKGKFADANIPKKLQNLIVAESGSNDGLGYPFLFLALYLIQYTHDAGLGSPGGAGKAIGYWFGIIWAYEIIMSTLYGALIGYIFRIALRYAEQKKFVDRESFIVFSITIALFIVGTLGMLGSDDVLACFVAGNVFSWDDWFREQTEDDTFQATIDMLLNVAIFLWYGAVCPWYEFAHNDVIPIYRLIFLGILILLLRRLPIVLALYLWPGIHQIEDLRQAFFVGFFGPMGVSAIFYLYTSRFFLLDLVVYAGHERADAERLAQVFNVVVWFIVICSIIVHGISIPIGKLGFHIPRTISQSRSMSRSNTMAKGQTDSSSPSDTRVPSDLEAGAARYRGSRSRREDDESDEMEMAEAPKDSAQAPSSPKDMRRIGGTLMHDSNTGTAASSAPPELQGRSIRYDDEENGTAK